MSSVVELKLGYVTFNDHPLEQRNYQTYFVQNSNSILEGKEMWNFKRHEISRESFYFSQYSCIFPGLEHNYFCLKCPILKQIEVVYVNIFKVYFYYNPNHLQWYSLTYYNGNKISPKFLFFIFLYSSLPPFLPVFLLPFFICSSCLSKKIWYINFYMNLRIILIVGCAFSLKDKAWVYFSQITTLLLGLETFVALL